MREVKEQVVPSLVESGLLYHNEETAEYKPATNWDEHQ